MVDLSVMIRASAARLKGKKSTSTFRTWLLSILNDVSKAAAFFEAEEIGVVTDFYSDISIKCFTRGTRGSSSQVKFSLDSILPTDLMSALTNAQFKTEVNTAFTLPEIISEWSWKKDFTMTKDHFILERIDGVIKEDRRLVMSGAAPSLEEADNRLILHVRDGIRRGRRNVLVRTVDSDLVVILLGFMGTFLDIDPNISILIDYGMMKRRLIRVND